MSEVIAPIDTRFRSGEINSRVRDVPAKLRGNRAALHRCADRSSRRRDDRLSRLVDERAPFQYRAAVAPQRRGRHQALMEQHRDEALAIITGYSRESSRYRCHATVRTDARRPRRACSSSNGSLGENPPQEQSAGARARLERSEVRGRRRRRVFERQIVSAQRSAREISIRRGRGGPHLIGLLAVDINPSTATITELEYGDADEATAIYEDGRTRADSARPAQPVYRRSEPTARHASRGDRRGATRRAR